MLCPKPPARRSPTLGEELVYIAFKIIVFMGVWLHRSQCGCHKTYRPGSLTACSDVCGAHRAETRSPNPLSAKSRRSVHVVLGLRSIRKQKHAGGSSVKLLLRPRENRSSNHSLQANALLPGNRSGQPNSRAPNLNYHPLSLPIDLSNVAYVGLVRRNSVSQQQHDD